MDTIHQVNKELNTSSAKCIYISIKKISFLFLFYCWDDSNNRWEKQVGSDSENLHVNFIYEDVNIFTK